LVFILFFLLYFNVSHTIRHLSFGDYFPGKAYPLDGVQKTSSWRGRGLLVLFYFISALLQRLTHHPSSTTEAAYVAVRGVPKGALRTHSA